MRTQVGIIGAGPAGLFLAHLLHRAGIESVILERRTRSEVETTLRAGVLEHWVTDLMTELGVGARMRREAHSHDGITLQWNKARFHLDIAGLTGGRHVTVYPQHEVLIDLIAARLAQGGVMMFETAAKAIDGIETDTPSIRFRSGADGEQRVLHCDYVVAADGFHGPGRTAMRAAIPGARQHEYETVYPFAWLGILTRAPQSWHELIYANQHDGFALCSTRSPTVQRLYLQCDADDAIAAWPDERIWAALQDRLGYDGWTLHEGPIMQKSIIPLRSFVCEPMQYGRLFLAGDAAHIVPPTGAKGLNLAVADVLVLSRALAARYHHNRQDLLAGYSDRALRRVWKAERFSWFMTTMLHRNDQAPAFQHKIHMADLDLIRTNRATAQAVAENYVGLPFDD